ncbi:MAG: T9SS type A sorting domain-containing protein [Calditrichaeota bacterium]|nr:T9SS type A sorting domain-containing protein [Calditrichota bacterium]
MHRKQASALLIMLLTALFITGATAKSFNERSESWLEVTDNGQSGISINIDFTTDEINQIGSIPDYSTLTQTDSGIEIPMISRLIALPPGHRAEVRVINRQSTLHKAGDTRANLTGTGISKQDLSSLRLDPPMPVIAGSVGSVRGVSVTSVSFYPYQYNEEKDEIIENISFEAEVTFVRDNNIQVTRPVRDLPGSDMSRMLDRILLNKPHRDPYSEVQADHRGRILILHQDNDDFGENEQLWVDSLANWKRQMGYSVEILAVNVNVQEGGLTGLEVRNQIVRERYINQEDPLSYLIIIGADSVQQRLWFPTVTDDVSGDHLYSVMVEDNEDDIYLSDIAVGRFHCYDFSELRGAILRSILYEREPYLDRGDEWFTSALVHAENIAVPGGGFVPSMIHLGRWEFVKLTRAGYSVDTLWVPDEDIDADDETRRLLEDGRSFVSSRGWLEACFDVTGDDPILAFVGRKNPFVLAITCLSTPTQSRFFRSATQNTINGSINAISLDNLSHSKVNNSFIGGALRSFVDFGLLNAGSILNLGKFQLWSDNRYELAGWALENVAITRLMGDPTTKLFTKVPVELTAHYTDALTLGSRGFSVYVEAAGEIVPGAWVTIWQEDRLHLVCQPGEDGWARFTFQDGDLDEGDLRITINHDNSIPYISSVEVAQAEEMVDIAGIDFEGDDIFANGENIQTSITFANSGNVDLNDVTIEVISEDPLVTFSDDSFQIDAFNSGAESDIQFDLQIHPASHGGRSVRVQIDVSSGESTWEHSFAFETSGHVLTELGLAVGNDFQPGEVAQLLPTILNSGDLATPEVTATLVCIDDDYITVTENVVRYEPIGGGREMEPEGRLEVVVDELAIPGNNVRFMLLLDAVEEDNAFVDTLFFNEIMGPLPETPDPFGPDSYGYIAFDSGDVSWEKCPEYDWVEINPSEEEDFVGEDLRLLDRWDSQDTSVTVDLPFSFRFYGEEFDAIAVNSNGWIAFGDDKSMFVDARNQQIPGIQGPDAMIAGFWQDMINLDPETRGVYTFYDDESDRFIIEWSKMKLWRDNTDQDQNVIEFQIILYDPAAFPTSTGNGEILVQYKSIYTFGGDQWDNYFHTTGLKNLDGSDGLEYCYWDHYPRANAHVEDEMAILFTTDRIAVFGGMNGRVTLHEDEEEGIEGVTVQSVRTGARTETMEDGRYEFDLIPAGRDEIVFSKPGFNTNSVIVDINQDEVLVLNASLTHPEIIASSEPVNIEVMEEEVSLVNFEIQNNGNGPLDYYFSRRFSDGSQTMFASQGEEDISSLTEEDRNIRGCEFIGDKVYITGGGAGRDFGNEFVYVFNHDFNNELVLQSSFSQSSVTRSGFMDLAFDGEFLYGAEKRNAEDFPAVIVKFDLDGEVHNTFSLPLERADAPTPWALAWNPIDEQLIVAGDESDAFVLDIEGNLVSRHELSIPGDVLRIRGAAWNPLDEDNMPLYLLDTNVGARLLKASLETGEIREVAVLREDEREIGGLTIGYDWDRSMISLGMIAGGVDNDSIDYLEVFELGPNTRFLEISPDMGQIAAGESANPELIFNAQDILADTYSFGLAIEHNAAGEEVFIEVSVVVTPVSVSDHGNGEIPLEFALNASYPNPFNSTTRIDFSLAETAPTRLAVYDLTGRLVSNLIQEKLEPGKYSVNFSPETMASGIYFYRLKSGQNSSVKRMVYLR